MATKSVMMGGLARRAAGSLGVAVVLALAAGPVSGQTPSETDRVYQREIFDYPSLGRRDPFRALNEGEQIGPRFEDLTVAGVLYNPAVGSVATLTDQKTGKRYRAREGDRFGEIRIAAIRAQEVDFVITSFGISRRETLRVDRDKETEG